MSVRKGMEPGLEEASAAPNWGGGVGFPLFKSSLWAEFGRIILYYNVKACLFSHVLSLSSCLHVSIRTGAYWKEQLQKPFELGATIGFLLSL
jgi:hypothetical protein